MTLFSTPTSYIGRKGFKFAASSTN